MKSLLEIFIIVDDFYKEFQPSWEKLSISNGQQRRKRKRSLTMSEIMTILIMFHQSNYRNFKAFYCDYVMEYWRKEFPGLVSYNRFVEYIPSTTIPLIIFLRTKCMGKCTGISFVDSTPLDVCLNQRIHTHKVFKDFAQRGKTSTGWFYGFKLHLIVNDCGELLSVCLTPGNVDDRKPVPQLAKDLFGKLFGDRGYVSLYLMETLRELFDLEFITKLRSNMKNRLMLLSDRILLRKRSIIETVIDQLKNISQIEHSRHRSVPNFFVNVLCGLIAYSFRPIKPSLGINIASQLVA